ncbi:hypothetical protein D3C85_1019640 [compost metagenome]
MRLLKMPPMASRTCFSPVMPFSASVGSSTFSIHSNWLFWNSSAPLIAPTPSCAIWPALSCVTLDGSAISPSDSIMLAARFVVLP